MDQGDDFKGAAPLKKVRIGGKHRKIRRIRQSTKIGSESKNRLTR